MNCYAVTAGMLQNPPELAAPGRNTTSRKNLAYYPELVARIATEAAGDRSTA
jgi:hypothetical protein